MRVVALDTTTRAGSVALIDGDRVVATRAGDGARTHALRMPAEIVDLAAANGWALSDADLFAVASGPGSFTGLRIGIATIQGLAFVHRRRVVAVPVLDALAHAAACDLPDGSVIGAWMDAHRGDVFAALYRVNGGAPFTRARLTALEPATVGTPAVTLSRWRARGDAMPVLIAGDGAMLYASDITEHCSATHVMPSPQLAGPVGLVAVDRAGEAVEPAELRPFYVRRPDVEVTRDEKLLRIAENTKQT